MYSFAHPHDFPNLFEFDLFLGNMKEIFCMIFTVGIGDVIKNNTIALFNNTPPL